MHVVSLLPLKTLRTVSKKWSWRKGNFLKPIHNKWIKACCSHTVRIWLHTSWNKLDDSEGGKSITKLVIFQGEPYDQYGHFHMVLTAKWGNTEITLLFMSVGPVETSYGLLGIPSFYLGGQNCFHMTHICVSLHTPCNIKYYSPPQQNSDITCVKLWEKYALNSPPSLCLTPSVSFFSFVCLSFISLPLSFPLHLCLSLGTSVILDLLKGLFRLILQTLIYD